MTLDPRCILLFVESRRLLTGLALFGEGDAGVMNEPCFSVCSFPSFLYSGCFRNEVSDVVIIMRFSINKSPPPLWGRDRVGGHRRGSRKHKVHYSGQGTRPPTLILPHKGGGDQKFGCRRFRPLGEAKSTNSRCTFIHAQTAVFISPGRGSRRAGTGTRLALPGSRKA